LLQIFQGIAPTFIGGFSDSAGRRLAYLICFVIYIAANLGLALQSTYAALLVLRMVQSSGSSATVALANAVAADLVTSAERGSYVGYTSVAGILAPTLSPIIGGLISEYAGWRWIFWFLLIFSVTFFVPFLLLFPETCRKIVGNGSIPPPALSHSLPTYLRERRLKKQGQHHLFEERDELAGNRKLQFPNPLSVLVIVFNKQASLILLSNGILFASWYVMSASLPSQFQTRYGLNDAQIGLLFIPMGVGSIISAFTTGKVIDWNYRRHARKLGMPVQRSRQDDLTNFPIERARLEISLPLLYLGAVAVVAYGWLLEYNTGIASVCVIMFVFGFCIIAGFNCMNILMVDIYPGKPASATAANNLVRCLLGAGSSAVVIPLINAIGVGWTSTLSAFLWIAFSPLIFLLMRLGPRWRKAMKAKREAKEERKRQQQGDVPQEIENADGMEEVELEVREEEIVENEKQTDGELSASQDPSQNGDGISEIGDPEKGKDAEAQE
jgi:MFS family permease